MLEDLAADSKVQNDWQNKVENTLNIKSGSVLWIIDQELRKSFKKVEEIKERSKPLSESAGKGMY